MIPDDERGISLPELLLLMALSTFIIGSALAALQSITAKMVLNQDLQKLISGINKARYLAIADNHSHRLAFYEDTMLIESRENGAYLIKERVLFSSGTKVRANASPVFSPLGFACPTATIRIFRDRDAFLLTIATTGRIRYKRQ